MNEQSILKICVSDTVTMGVFYHIADVSNMIKEWFNEVIVRSLTSLMTTSLFSRPPTFFSNLNNLFYATGASL